MIAPPRHPVYALSPPVHALSLLNRTPSWVNRAGRVDRCACLEVRASELWPLIPSHNWNAVRTATDLLAHAPFTVTTRLLQHLHDQRLPRRFTGDLRTPKSNAMKSSRDPQRRRRLNRKKGEQPWTALPDVSDALYCNPNHGAARSKIIALPDCTWRQDVRIERWRRGKKRSAVSDQQVVIRGEHSAVSGQHTLVKDPPWRAPSHHSAPPTHWHYLICPACQNRVFKLMWVLAFPQELIEAAFAEQWIQQIDARLAASRQTLPHTLAAIRAQLIDRYGLLFPDSRRLICRTCLGVRYGEVRKSRQILDPHRAAARSRERLAAQSAREAAQLAEADAALLELVQLVKL